MVPQEGFEVGNPSEISESPEFGAPQDAAANKSQFRPARERRNISSPPEAAAS